MSLNVCGHCSTRFSIGAPHCPQCGNADYYEEGTMAKISRHGGPSYILGEDGPEILDLPAAAVVEPDGVLEAALDEVFDLESDDVPDGPYGAMLRADLQAECVARGLPSSGTKAELVARLAAADEADAAEEPEDSDAA